MKWTFCGIQHFSLPPEGLFSRSQLLGTQGTRLYTTVQVWAPTGLRGACSGHSKLRNLASNHGTAFRRVTANQAHRNPHNMYIFRFSPLSAAVSEGPQQPSMARQPRYNSRALRFSLCDSHSRYSHERSFCMCVRERVCVRVCHYIL